jgi:class 3 adenylate cyclase
LATATKTVVFTDLEGYTEKVAAADRQGIKKILEDHESRVKPIVERFGGRVVKNLGDSFMCLFPSATDGLRAAVEILDFVAEKPVSPGSGAMRLPARDRNPEIVPGQPSAKQSTYEPHRTEVKAGGGIRVALTTGDVEELNEDAFGDAVNLAARILAKAPAGQIWFGPGTRVCMNASEIAWEEVGRHTFKGMSAEKEIFRAVPKHKCWLPEAVLTAIRERKLLPVKSGATAIPNLAADKVILLEDFDPKLASIDDALNKLLLASHPTSQIFLIAYTVSGEFRQAWQMSGRGLVIGTPDAVKAAVEEAERQFSRATGGNGSDTIVLDLPPTLVDVNLVLSGLALPAVPLSEVVSSYTYDLLADGRWVNKGDRAVARVDVSTIGVRLHAMASGVSVGGKGLGQGMAVGLSDQAEIRTPAGLVTFRATDLASGYVGLLISDSDMNYGLVEGQTVELGREPNPPGLAFPDRRGQDNIQWYPGQRAAKARAGGFTLDRALAGRRQASVTLRNEQLTVRALHDRCPTLVLPANGTELRAAPFEQDHPVQVGELLVLGTTVVAVREPE